MKGCSKCGSTDLKIKFVPKSSLITSSSSSRVENEFIRCTEYDFFYKLNAAKDHLVVACNTCGYSIRTRTNDDRE